MPIQNHLESEEKGRSMGKCGREMKREKEGERAEAWLLIEEGKV